MDLWKQAPQATIPIGRGENDGRRLVISLTDNGVPFRLEEGYYAVFAATKPDGTVIYDDCAMVGGQIVYDISEQAAAVAGVYRATVEIWQADGVQTTIVATPCITVVVRELAYDRNVVASSNTFKALESFLTSFESVKAGLVADIETLMKYFAWLWEEGDGGESIRSIAEDVTDSRLSAHNASTGAHPFITEAMLDLYARLSSLDARLKTYAAEGHLHDDLYVKKGEAVDGVPSYVVDEGKAVAGKVTAVRDAYSFVFGAISDLHTNGTAAYSADSILHAGMGLHEIHKRTRLDAVLNFGDVIVTDLEGAYAEGFPFVRSCLDDMTRGVPYIQMQGNHDEYDSAYTEAEEKQKYFAHIGANNTGVVTDWTNRHRNYGYRDFEDEKMRVVYLNSVDLSTIETTDSTLGGNDCYISGAQFKWFIETALDFSGKSDAENWSFVVCCHHPLNWYGVTMPKLLAVLKAYRDKASGSVVADGITTSYDFTGAKAMLVAHFHGHLHNFRAETLDGVPTITIPNACFGRNNEYGQNESQKEKWGDADANGTQRIFNKVSDSADDTSFNVIVVDRTNEVVHCINYGAGIDRVVSYGAAPKVYRSITNTLSNVTTSNSASSVEDGASYSATLTASEDYSMTGGTVSVKMGGVDITATAYSGGVINIASVTGDVVITATAVAVPTGPNNLIDTVGYTDGVRLSTSSGGESSETGHVTTGFIPIAQDDVIRTKGVDFNFVSNVNKSAYVIYQSDKSTKVTSNNIKPLTGNVTITLDSDGNITYANFGASVPSGGGYLRICGKGVGANLIVTKNEEIV